jgi:hypothetical protein
MPLRTSCLGFCCIAFLSLFGFFGTCIPLGLATLGIRIEGSLTPEEHRREGWRFLLVVMASGCVASAIAYWIARLWFRLDSALRPRP